MALATAIGGVLLPFGGCAPGTTPASSALPPLCSAARPPAGPSFVYNRDLARRGQLLHLGDAHGGVRNFEGVPVDDAATLFTERFVSPDDRQNESPDAWQMFRFQCRHPEIRLGGYAVDPGRPDYRTTFDSIDASHASARFVAEARAFCAQSDEPQFDEGVSCRWD